MSYYYFPPPAVTVLLINTVKCSPGWNTEGRTIVGDALGRIQECLITCYVHLTIQPFLVAMAPSVPSILMLAYTSILCTPAYITHRTAEVRSLGDPRSIQLDVVLPRGQLTCYNRRPNSFWRAEIEAEQSKTGPELRLRRPLSDSGL